MKNKKLLVFVLTLISSLTSCDFKAFSEDEFVGYADGSVVTNDNLELNMSNLSIYEYSEKYSISFSMYIKNTDSKSITTSLENYICYRDSDGADYGMTSTSDISDITLNCDLSWGTTCMFTLPTSPADETYYVFFNLLGDTYKFYLNDKPDDLKTQYKVSFYIDGIFSESVNIAEGKSFSNIDWISSDYVYYCNTWYYDKDLTDSVGLDELSGEVDLYGTNNLILKYNCPDSTTSCFISGVNYIPKSGEIVVPRSYINKTIYALLSGAFNYNLDGLKTIYIPLDISRISSNNFTSLTDLENICFEGTSSQWNSINDATIPSDVEVIFNTYK